MTTRRWFRNVGSGRGNPRARLQKPWRRAALAVVALTATAQAGCAGLRADVGNAFTRVGNRINTIGSGAGSGCGSCGLLGGRRIFRSAPVVESYEPGVIAAPVVEAVPGAVIQGPAAPLLPAPPAIPADEMPRLEPAEPAPPGSEPQSRNGGGGAVKSVYETSTPRIGIGPAHRRGDSLKSSSGPDSIRRPAPPTPLPVDEVLSELPPITATIDGGQPLASSLPEEAGPAPAALVAAKTGGASAPAPADAEAEAEINEPPPQPTAGSLGAAPGISRFKAVKSGLAGGDVPNADGWAWLSSLGYKSVLDLRERSEVQPADLAEIDQNGLIRISLPVSLETLDERHLEQFENLISQPGLRPLFFFDTAGVRSAVLWYVHRVGSGEADSQDAARTAAEIGRIDPKYWVAATALLTRRHPSATPTAVDPAPPEVPSPDQTPAAAREPQAETPTDSTLAASEASANPPELTRSPAPATTCDPSAWRPYATMILTGLGMPLAYFGRSVLVNLGSSVRASLPGPARATKSLPSASDV